MLKVVDDPNELVPALLKPDSVPEFVLSLVLSGEIILCLSEPVAIEYEKVLKRPKFKKPAQGKVEELLSRLRSEAHRVDPKSASSSPGPMPKITSSWNAPLEAKADFLITGNTKHFPPGKFKETVILNPAQFLPVAARLLDLWSLLRDLLPQGADSAALLRLSHPKRRLADTSALHHNAERVADETAGKFGRRGVAPDGHIGGFSRRMGADSTR